MLSSVFKVTYNSQIYVITTAFKISTTINKDIGTIERFMFHINTFNTKGFFFLHISQVARVLTFNQQPFYQ